MNKLPLESIRLLSSSQVITSPSLAVKELVENAFDAGATNLDIKMVISNSQESTSSLYQFSEFLIVEK